MTSNLVSLCNQTYPGELTLLLCPEEIPKQTTKDVVGEDINVVFPHKKSLIRTHVVITVKSLI